MTFVALLQELVTRGPRCLSAEKRRGKNVWNRVYGPIQQTSRKGGIGPARGGAFEAADIRHIIRRHHGLIGLRRCTRGHIAENIKPRFTPCISSRMPLWRRGQEEHLMCENTHACCNSLICDVIGIYCNDTTWIIKQLCFLNLSCWSFFFSRTRN